jgi:glycosyltransferase involved in cell wall biosynthesis
MLAGGLAARGVQVTVLGPRSVAWPQAMAREPAVTFAAVEIGSRPRITDVGVVLRLRRLLCAAAPGTAGPGAAGPDVVHAHGLRAGALCVLALRAGLPRWPGRSRAPDARARRRPAVVVTMHNAPPLAGGAAALVYRVLEVIVARGADVVLCVSEDLRRRARAAGARRAGHAVVPAPATRRASPRTAGDGLAKGRLALPGDRPVVLAAGRLAPQKGMGVLLEAAASWADLDPVPLLVIAGEGPLAAGLRERAAALGVDAIFPGHRDDLPELMAAAAVIVVPSLWEGQPLVLQEALRAGVPIVATRAGGIPGLTGTGEAGGGAAELVRPGDWRELAAAVRAVLTDQALAARLRAAALDRAAALPSAADALDAVLASYAAALSRPAPVPWPPRPFARPRRRMPGAGSGHAHGQ